MGDGRAAVPVGINSDGGSTDSVEEAVVMMIKFGLILAGFAVFCSAAEKNVTLSGDKWKWVIENFSGFNLWRRNETWTINTDSSSTIKLFCLEIKLPSRSDDSCNIGKLVFDDGVSKTTYCGRSENVLYQGNSSKLVVDFVTQPNSGSVFYCKGKSVHPPRTYETIDVKPGASIQVKYPKVLEKDSDQAFLFNSTTGSPITLTCTKKMERPLRSGECVKDILTIDAGNGPSVSCGKGHVSATGTEIRMRVETYQATEGHVNCVVKG